MEVGKTVKIAVIGATGYVGAPISREALARGHDVTAISRSGALPDGLRAQARSVDIFDSDALARVLQGHAAAIHAFNPGRGRTDPAVFDTFVRGHEAIIAAAQRAGVSRLLCVGGAGSLKTRDGIPRVGTDYLLYDEAGKSHISLADYACAMIDELESPAHHCQRFTVGY
jgi:putative NADH-flavin reductase